MTLSRLAGVHLLLGSYDEAAECHHLAWDIFSRIENIRGEASELHSLGLLYGSRDRHDKAEEWFAEARTAYARSDAAKGDLEGLGASCAVQAKFAEAAAACVEARGIYAPMGQPMRELGAYIWQGFQ